MELDLNRITKKIEQNDFVKKFIKELSDTLENFKKQKYISEKNDYIDADVIEDFVDIDKKENINNIENSRYNQNNINSNNKYYKGEDMDEIKLTQEEELKLYRKKLEFLEDFFKKELADLSKGEIFIVTNKYENDIEYHRYKVTQYKDYKECKYIAFEKDLPENVKLGDIVRKIDGKYIYDEIATKYVADTIRKFKEEIIS